MRRYLAKNFRRIDRKGLEAIEDSLRRNFYKVRHKSNRYSRRRFEDLQAHLYKRLEFNRHVIVPWLNHVRRLRGCRILEVGCGTGSSTIALAEQGSQVTGIDISSGALAVAKDRAKAYGVAVAFRRMKASNIARVFKRGEFDWIIFFACLEHMDIRERLSSLRAAWEMLPGSGLLAVVGTPNRLWYCDTHTALLPFFHWLPDELALQYARFSPREDFCGAYRRSDAASKRKFLKRGRGISFHEFDLALGRPVKSLKVMSSLV